MTTATDAFTNTNGTAITTHNANYTYLLGGTAHNVLEINANGCRTQADAAQSTGGQILVTRSDLTWAADQYSEITVTDVSPAVGAIFIGVRSTAGNSGYHLYIEPTQLRIYQGDDSTQVGSTFSSTLANGQTIRLRAIGTAIAALLNGSVVISATNSAHASGKPSFGGQGNAGINPFMLFDNWTGSDVFATRRRRNLRSAGLQELEAV